MQKLNITSAKYCLGFNGENQSIVAIIEHKEYAIPLDPANCHYAEIMRQVEAGELVIQEATQEVGDV
jgi:hypothetical protein